MTVLDGGPGNDVLEGDSGSDEIDGGEDDGLGEFFGSARNSIWGDTATYVHSDAGVTIDLGGWAPRRAGTPRATR